MALLTPRDLVVIQAALEHVHKHAKTDAARWAVEDAIGNVERLKRQRARNAVAAAEYRARKQGVA